MRSVKYLTSMGELKRKDNSLVFRTDKGHTYIPIEGIKEIYCLNEISINSKLFQILAKAGIVVHFFDYHRHYTGTFYPKQQLVSGRLIVKQVEAYQSKRLPIAKAIVGGIANHIYQVLLHYYKHGTSDLKPLLDWLRKDVPSLLDKELRIDQGLFGRNFTNPFNCFYQKIFCSTNVSAILLIIQ
ncbi:CRISPR-associated endonuclease Cas1 [Polycladospora coralii]|uniref:CRISPR-associated endonuclease Cas1 n=1 Tax=Polycladospora coralii TaxID=2771432 RepID=UPI0024BE69BD|nr:CRISPR-associated endonuclease Cas1 [Polycladospora coralii]